MTKVLKADVSGLMADAFAEKALVFPGHWYMRYRWAVTTATLANLTASSGGVGDKNSAVPVNLSGNGGDGFLGVDFGSTGTWKTEGDFDPSYGAGSAAGLLTGDVWHTVLMEYNGVNIKWTFDGALLFNYALAPANADTPIQVGSTFTQHVAGEQIYYIADLVIGTTPGGSDIFDANFSSGTLAAFDSETNPSALSLVNDPFPAPSASEGIRIAFASDTHDTSPFWTRIDDPTYPAVTTNSNVVQGWETHRGRQYELDKTQAGTAILNIFDSTGRLDPSNVAGPYYGNILPLKQTKINVQNPVDGSYHDIFTGYVESWQYQLTPDEQVLMINANLTDGFELLARAEVVPDATGTTTYAAAQVNTRILAALADGDWPSLYTNVFTGNVDMQETIYNPQTSILSVIQDAADAEFPNVANIFMDKFGDVAFRGRWSRFNPSHYSADPPTPSHPIRFWSVGDREAAETFTIVPIQDIQWNLDLKNVINACLCMPYGIQEPQISAQLKTDATSISKYGVRALSIPDLIIQKSIAGPVGPPFPATNPGGDGVGAPSANANAETQIIGQYYVSNYANPVEMISSITFQSIAPTDTLGPAWWKFVTGIEIGDVVIVTQTNPGGGGFKATQFFVEGIHNVVSLGSPDGLGKLSYPQWTMNLDLTPRLWYSVFNGVTYYP